MQVHLKYYYKLWFMVYIFGLKKWLLLFYMFLSFDNTYKFFVSIFCLFYFLCQFDNVYVFYYFVWCLYDNVYEFLFCFLSFFIEKFSIKIRLFNFWLCCFILFLFCFLSFLSFFNGKLFTKISLFIFWFYQFISYYINIEAHVFLFTYCSL